MSVLTFDENIELALYGGVTAALANLTPVPRVAILGRDFPPKESVPYARATILWGNRRAVDMPPLTTRIDALLQVDLCYPSGSGGRPTNVAVGFVLQKFKHGAAMSSNGTVVYIRGCRRAGGKVERGFLCTPLTISFYAYDLNPS